MIMNLRFRGSATPPPVVYDYLITNDGNSGVANSWDNIVALGGATLSGKTIGVQPGTYAKKTLSLNGNADYITFIATDTNNKPIINEVVLGIDAGAVANKLKFQGVEVWASTPWVLGVEDVPAVAYTNWNDIHWEEDCVFRSGYRGDCTVPFDPTKNDYPELASLLPVFNGTGGIASITINNFPNCYVGDLKADGTYPLIFDNVDTTIVFTVTPTGTFTVSGGYIVSTSITLAGASNATTATNGSTGIISKCISWIGKMNIVSYISFGHQAVLASGNTNGDITVRDCRLYDFSSAIKVTPQNGQTITVVGNFLDRIYGDFLSFGMGIRNPPYTPTSLVIEWNVATRGFSKAGDPGDPHGDFLQYFVNDLGASNTWTTVSPNVRIVGNVYYTGNARGSVQGIFLSEIPTTGIGYGPYIVGNAVLTTGLTNGLTLDAADDAYIYRNTIARYDYTSSGNTSAIALRTGSQVAVGQSVFLENIYENITIDNYSNAVESPRVGSVILGPNGATIPYASVFSAPLSAPNTLADVVSAFTTIGAYIGKGAFNSDGYINHATRTVNTALEKPYISFIDIFDQTQSTPVSSTWRRILGGNASIALTGMTGGTYQIADDDTGTNATVASAADTTVASGKYIRINVTTGGSGSVTQAGTFALNGYAYGFAATTASVIQFTAIDNQATAYSNIAQPASNAGLSKLLLAIRVRTDVLTTNSEIFANATGALRLYFATTVQVRFAFINSSIILFRNVTTMPTAGQTQTHIIAVDFNEADADLRCKWWIGGTRQVPFTGSVIEGFGTTFNTSIALNSGLGLFNKNGGTGVQLDGAVEFLWMDWGDSNHVMPDIDLAVTRNKFTGDLINLANGSGPTGSQPKLFFPGDSNVADWNSGGGVTNRGSLVNPLIKRAGTYI